MPHIVPLTRIPEPAVEALLDRAFGADRWGRTAYRIREGTHAIEPLSFAAIDAMGAFLGSIQCWPVQLLAADDAATPLVMVGPVAVDPEVQREGIGKALMRATLDAARAIEAPPLVMIGDPEYYGRFFGFSAERTGGWRVDGPVERRRLLALVPPGAALPDEARLVPRP